MNIKRAFLMLAATLLLPVAVHALDSTGTFTVTKAWSPSNTATVPVRITCNTGTPQVQDAVLSTAQNVIFIVNDLPDSSSFTCEIIETTVPSGHTAGYSGGANAATDTCNYTFSSGGTQSETCAITNTAAVVTFTVTKKWDVTRVGGDVLNSSYDITLFCDQEIESDGGDSGTADDCSTSTPWYCEWNEQGTDKLTDYWVKVVASGATPSCYATESIVDSSVEIANGCGSSGSPIDIAVGESESCTITNTVYYEGIPTLNQYGLAIMALLMLGVGFVGFRRFV